MAHVPGYSYDVFISYAQLNNCENWVSKFRSKLEARLRERVPTGVEFFRDTEDVQGNDDLTPEIITGIRNAAVLVMIVSIGYLQSKWCMKECEEFLASNRSRGIEGRIFAVRYDDISPGEYQKFIGEKLGYKFFADPVEDRKYADALDPESEAFKAKMNVLRVEIAAKLEELKARAEVPPQETTAAVSNESDRPALFLAHPSVGLESLSDQFASYLTGLGYEVIQPGEKFYEIEGYEETFSSALKRSLIFVQLLGRHFTARSDDHVASWDRWQYLQAQSAELPIFQWFNKYDANGNELDLQKLDADHREFVSRSGVWDCEPHKFREIVRKEADKRDREIRQQRQVKLNGGKPFVVLRAERADRQFADTDVGRTFSDHHCEWMRIPDKDVASLEDFAVRNPANGIVVVYRACSNRWLLDRLQELRKFVWTEIGDRWACGIWRAPEDSEDAVSCSLERLFIIEPHDQRGLQLYVKKLREQI